MTKLQLTVVGLGMLWMVGCSTTPDFYGPRPGEVWKVSTQTVTMRAQPDALSPAVKILSYQDAANVKADVRVALPFAGDRNLFPESLIPGWVQADAGGQVGYLPVSSLASEWLINHQNPKEEITATGMVVRNFSNDEAGDLSTIRGAAGQGLLSMTNDAAAVDMALKNKVVVSDGELTSFLQAGLLRGRAVPPQVVATPAKGGIAKFAEGAQQFTSSGIHAVSDSIKQQQQLQVNDNNLAGSLVTGTGNLLADFIYSEIGAVQEFQTGKAVAARVFPLYKKVPEQDPRARYVNQVAQLVAAASNDPMPYAGLIVTLVEAKEVNAFAVPGGFLFITTGMLDFVHDEDELAAILGHEIGHMELRHGMTAVGKENVLKLFSLLKQIGTGEGQGPAQSELEQKLRDMIDNLFGQMLSKIRDGYGVDLESQADWRSLQLSARLGYDSKALYEVLERFKQAKGSYGGASYPEQRGTDILRYREQLGIADGPVTGRAERKVRFAQSLGR